METHHSYRASPAIWDHAVLPVTRVTRHRSTRRALTPAKQADIRDLHTHLEGIES